MLKRTMTDLAGDITPDEVARRLAVGEQLLVLDVRQPDEYAEGHVAGSTLIPLDQLALRLDELPKDRPIAVICRSGNRSGVATGMLLRDGFTAANVTGGMLAWQQRSLAMEHGA